MVRHFGVAALLVSASGCMVDRIVAAPRAERVMAPLTLSPVDGLPKRRVETKPSSPAPLEWCCLRALCRRGSNVRFPLYVIDGRTLSSAEASALSNMDPARIANIEILGRDEATRRFGRAATDGAVLITLKH